MGIVVGAALGTLNRLQETAGGIVQRGRDVTENATSQAKAKARSSVRTAADYTEDKLDQAADVTEELADKAEDALDEPDYRAYEERTYEELYELASERDIAGRSTMNKAELIAALRDER
ncbi:MAG: Rho termination factor N-terminal domain-containing protein [Gammaproteobacteria bacterium]|nr:Rho termination factor N-terminal domain-containing protein [Gammaproteobacteria bacterium]NND60471.1 hypothetical protein [Gammaproteobacteria bacterium]